MAAAPPTQEGEDFVPAMRKATRRAHSVANVLILAKLAVALTDKQLYGKALGQFAAVYAELEAVLAANRGDPVLGEVAGLVLGVPSRAEALKEDLQVWVGVVDVIGPVAADAGRRGPGILRHYRAQHPPNSHQPTAATAKPPRKPPSNSTCWAAGGRPPSRPPPAPRPTPST
jgi:hypothetical protein